MFLIVVQLDTLYGSTGWFWALRSKIMSVTEEKYVGGKYFKERLTEFLYCDLKGEKEKGKAAKIRCFEIFWLLKFGSVSLIWPGSRNYKLDMIA